jgi:hypothetical protein
MQVTKDTTRIALQGRTVGGRPVGAADNVIVVMSEVARRK